MIKRILFGVLAYTAALAAAEAQYEGWLHTGTFCILTTPDGANLPATAREEGFPLLVRLNSESFDFNLARPDGADVRFSAGSRPLPYEIEEWDSARGIASIWVRIPAIEGNAQQEFHLHWGKADAASESSGSAVFNDSNGYLSVFHMNEPLRDSAGTVSPADAGTTRCGGMIGQGRHFAVGTRINCGTNIATFPEGSSPHTTEVWIRTDKPTSGRIVCWGVGKPNSVVQMTAARPFRIRMDCFYSPAGIMNDTVLPLSEWTQAAYVFQPGEARLYVNGRLDGSRAGNNVQLSVGRPAMLAMGDHAFCGDLDEVRVSKVARSAGWIKLQYENQKPLQTLVGGPVTPGSAFSVAPEKVSLDEGGRVTIAAKAGGARKVYWIVRQAGIDTTVAADQYSYTLDAGRIAGSTSLVVRFKAVYPDGARTLDVPVSICETLPEPACTLKAPAKWNGRDAIEILPVITNLKDLQAKGVAGLQYRWTVDGGAVIKQVAPDRLVLKRSQCSGPLTVRLELSNGGAATHASTRIMTTEPKHDAWIQRIPDKDEKPVDSQFYAREDKDTGTLFYNGTLDKPAEEVFLRLYAGEKLVRTERQKPGTGNSYAFSLKLKAGLIKYKVEFGVRSGGSDTVLRTVTNLVCGDAYLIDGQSNAVAYNYHNVTNRPDFFDVTSDWIRSYGSHGEAGPEHCVNGGWGNAVATNLVLNGSGGVRFVGCWGMTLARRLVADQRIPICILQGAVGGTRIDEHLRSKADPEDARTIYGRLLKRVKEARLTHGIRGVLWHQGEADQGFDGPDNCFGCDTYRQYFIDLAAAWKEDYPNIRNYYLFQIWPNACGQGGNGASDRLRDVQRQLPRYFSGLSVMPTLAFPSGENCHFKLSDYEQMGLSMVPLLERDVYGRTFDKPVAAPDLQRAFFTGIGRDEIALEFDQPVAWNDALAKDFFLDGREQQVVSGATKGTVLTLRLAAPVDAKAITYLNDRKWGRKTVLYGRNGIAALTFCEVPIERQPDSR